LKRPTEQTFRLVLHMRSAGRWETITELARALGVTIRSARDHVKFLEKRGVVECYPLCYAHKYHYKGGEPEFEKELGRWCRTQVVTL